tara:strand:- start:49 stop:2067 length:2019 start_codon:yes stop_codon:yes gene_type:complete
MSEKKYYHRDLSWLSFNERVLQEAEDKTNSLNDRLKFLAIFSSNLDEFYRVRVSKLRQFRRLQKDSPLRLKEKPKKIIKAIQKRVDKLQERFGFIYKEKLLKELNAEGVNLIEASDFNDIQQEFSSEFFEASVKKPLKIYELNSDLDLSFIKDKELFFFANVSQPLLISIPTKKCGRFITFPGIGEKKHITFLDEIIRDNISKVLPELRREDLFSVKITRDGELYYEEEDGELIELIKQSLKHRDYGIPTRVLYDSSIGKEDVKILRKCLSLKKTDLMPGGRFHNFSDFFHFPEIESRISESNNGQLAHHSLELVDSIIDHISEKNELLSFPYQKYDPILNLINEASERKDVNHIYITLYRISKDSSVAIGLMNCLAKGKKVTVFVEAKARFDEENNIEWGEKLDKAGARVLYSMPDIKVHSKILLIETKTKNIGYIGTGNFNENSAKIYADFGLLTSDKAITTDLKEVFKFLLDTSYKPSISKIWMSPFTTRKELNNRIDNEIDIAKNGGNGYLFFKMNSLEDKDIIDRLYKASQFGVEIKLLVRGICCLVPGLKGISENIEVVSIVGKYLEHARVYVFGNNGKNEMFIGSADCMERNLDRRVEVIVPIQDGDIKKTIETCIDLQWHDNTKGRIIDAKQKNIYQTTGKSKINSQLDFKEYLQSKNYQIENA